MHIKGDHIIALKVGLTPLRTTDLNDFRSPNKMADSLRIGCVAGLTAGTPVPTKKGGVFNTIGMCALVIHHGGIAITEGCGG